MFFIYFFNFTQLLFFNHCSHFLVFVFCLLVCLGITDFPKIFCETSQKLVSVEAFALAAKYYSIQNLGICVPFEHLLISLQGNQKQKTGRCMCVCMFLSTWKQYIVHIRISLQHVFNLVLDLTSGAQIDWLLPTGFSQAPCSTLQLHDGSPHFFFSL